MTEKELKVAMVSMLSHQTTLLICIANEFCKNEDARQVIQQCQDGNNRCLELLERSLHA